MYNTTVNVLTLSGFGDWALTIVPEMSILILIGIWVIGFISMKDRFFTPQAFTFSSFMCSILGLLIYGVGWINGSFVIVFFVMTGLGVIWLMNWKGR